ncbi:MAG: metallophosphoesterase [Acidobacteriota bacterium]
MRDAELNLEPVRELQKIRGIPFAQGTGYRQLVVTGPHGCGKTTLIQSIGGWPEEGFLDLTESRWWRSRILTFRPREVHLGFPFRGYSQALALFERDFLEAPEALVLEPKRVHLPQEPSRWSFVDWRRRVVFEFLLPPAEEVFESRRQRASFQTHPVDAEVSLEKTAEELRIYGEIARLFHRAGLTVYVRDGFGAPPHRIAEKRSPGAAGSTRRPRRSLVETTFKRIIRSDDAPIVEVPHGQTLTGEQIRIPVSALPVEIDLGFQALQVHQDHPLAPGTEWSPDLLIFDPAEYRRGISGFTRLGSGQSTRIGQREASQRISLPLPSDVRPWLEMSFEGDYLCLADLHSPKGCEVREAGEPVLLADRAHRLARLKEIFGGSFDRLEPKGALECLQAVNAQLESSPLRRANRDGEPGGLIELPDHLVPVLVGDLHAKLENLVKILTENRFLDELERKRAALVLLGDAVHREESQLAEMGSSVVAMDLILRLMRALPGHVVYLLGNHDSFSHEVTKRGVEQGRLWRTHLHRTRGERYVEEMRRFYRLSPHVALSKDFIACHAGPPLGKVTRQAVVNIRHQPKLTHQLTWIRLRRPGKPTGYGKRDVVAFRRALGKKKSTAFIVSHNPLSDDATYWQNAGGIKGHHIVYSARSDRLAVFTRIDGMMVPLEYRVEPLTRL